VEIFEAVAATWFSFALGTVFLFMPIYLPYMLVKMLTNVKIKPVDKAVAWVVVINALMASGPCALPLGVIGALAWAVRQTSGQANRGNRRNRRQNRSRDDEDDD
jgi:hypothetical protein